MSSLPKKESPPESPDASEKSMTKAEVLEIIRRYEAKYGISSEEFRKRWKAGTMEDSFDTNDWAILLGYL
jgi:hypothetical protein